MLANGGVLDGRRVLSRTTVKLMTPTIWDLACWLPQLPAVPLLSASSYTFGLGFAVRPSDGIAPVPGSAGNFNWGSYAGAIFAHHRRQAHVRRRRQEIQCGVI
jgi:hypothetical protein